METLAPVTWTELLAPASFRPLGAPWICRPDSKAACCRTWRQAAAVMLGGSWRLTIFPVAPLVTISVPGAELVPESKETRRPFDPVAGAPPFAGALPGGALKRTSNGGLFG